jgi:hypothetical protein
MKMSLRKAAIVLLLAYAIAPVIAGILNNSDPRGPIIYPRDYHEIAHAIGEDFAGRRRSKDPIDRERPLFYGMESKPINRKRFMRRPDGEDTQER